MSIWMQSGWVAAGWSELELVGCKGDFALNATILPWKGKNQSDTIITLAMLINPGIEVEASSIKLLGLQQLDDK